MLFNVPQFIDIEDKIVGPLTAKQLGWIAAGGVIFLILWNTLDTSAFVIATILDCAVFGALAFYKPYNQPLLKFILSSFQYIFRPKIYIWRRNYDNMKTAKKNVGENKEAGFIPPKILQEEKLKKISRELDSLK